MCIISLKPRRCDKVAIYDKCLNCYIANGIVGNTLLISLLFVVFTIEEKLSIIG